MARYFRAIRMPRRHLTDEIAPLDLLARAAHEDFVVEEVPLFAPSGEGTHWYLTIEKRGVTTAEAVRGIARRLGRRASEVGVAGLKDARALARQTISIEHVDEEDLERVEDPPRVRLLAAARHSRKLRTAFLKGNRFSLRLRAPEGGSEGVVLREGEWRRADGSAVAFRRLSDEELERARRVIARLSAEGIPNGFGEQRFGGRAATHLLGRALLRGEDDELLVLLLGRPGPGESARVQEARRRYEAGDLAGAREAFPRSYAAEHAALRVLLETGGDHARAIAAIGKRERAFYVHAAQSQVFNALLEERLAAGTLGAVEAGDVAYIHKSGGCFLVEDLAADAPRAERREISAAGPLWGARLLMAGGAVRAREEAALAAFGLEPRHLEGPAARAAPGARRPYRVPLEDARVEREPDGALRLDLTLPAGAYATAVIGELTKR